ncbi:unnamed protein product [Parajaminaea phylloscopi]
MTMHTDGQDGPNQPASLSTTTPHLPPTTSLQREDAAPESPPLSSAPPLTPSAPTPLNQGSIPISTHSAHAAEFNQGSTSSLTQSSLRRWPSYSERLEEAARKRARDLEEARQKIEEQRIGGAADGDGLSSDDASEDSLEPFDFAYRREIKDSGDDLDFLQEAMSPSPSPSPPREESLSPPPPTHMTETETSPARPRRSAARVTKYRFRPALYKTARTEAPVVTFAQKAGIRGLEPGKTGKNLTIDNLLKEKRRQEQRGTDVKSLDAMQQQIDWQRTHPDHDSDPGSSIEAEMQQASQRLLDARVRRAGEGLSEDADGHVRNGTLVSSANRGSLATSRDYAPRSMLADARRAGNAIDAPSARPQETSPIRDLDEQRIEKVLEKVAKDSSEPGVTNEIIDILKRERSTRSVQLSVPPGQCSQRPLYCFWSAGCIDKSDQRCETEADIRDRDVFTPLTPQVLRGLASSMPSKSGESVNPQLRDLVQTAVRAQGEANVLACEALGARLRRSTNDTPLLTEVAMILLGELSAMGGNMSWLSRSPTTDPEGQPDAGPPPCLHREQRNLRIQRVVDCLGLWTNCIPQPSSPLVATVNNVLHTLFLMGCDEQSFRPLSAWQLEGKQMAILKQLSWSELEAGWYNLVQRDVQALPLQQIEHPRYPRHPDTWTGLLKMLRALPSGSPKGRLIQRRCAYRLLTHGCSSIEHSPGADSSGQLVPSIDLGVLGKTLESSEPNVNPLWMPGSREDDPSGIRYAELDARVQILSLVLTDLALQLAVSAHVRPDTDEQTSGASEMTQTQPLPSEDDAEHDTLNTASNTNSLFKEKAVKLQPTQAFRAAIAPYLDDSDFVQTYWLEPATVHDRSSDRMSTSLPTAHTLKPRLERLREVHRITNLLEIAYSRMPDGRRPARSGQSRPDGTATPLEENHSKAPSSLKVARENLEDPIWQTRLKDTLLRMTHELDYQCEMYTAHRRKGDFIVKPKGSAKAVKDDAQLHCAATGPDAVQDTEVESVGLDEVAPDVGLEAATTEPTQAPQKAVDVSAGESSTLAEPAIATEPPNDAFKRRRIQGPRVAAQRSITDFYRRP